MGEYTSEPDSGDVSILVFVELALDEKVLDQNASFNAVSILVFVELALDDLRGRSMVVGLICFNPCFRGTCS